MKEVRTGILALATTVTSTDGVGVYTSEFLSSIGRLFPDSTCAVVALDIADDQTFPEHWPVRTTKGRFDYTFRAVAIAVRYRPAEIIVFHVGLLPAAWIAAHACGARITLITYGWDVSRYLNRLRRVLATRVHRAVAISRHTAVALENFFQPGLPRNSSTISLLPPTFDDDVYHRDLPAGRSFRAQYGLSDGDFLLLTVGRLDSSERDKGHDRVIRALPLLLRTEPSLKYVIVGVGDDIARLQFLADELDLTEVVHFLGRVDDLPGAYSGCDLFVMPSTQEGFGIVFIEALACGLPVVAGALDGSASAVLWGEIGFLCDPYDVESVARAVHSAMNSLRAGDSRSDPAPLRQRVISKFGRDAFDQRLWELLKERASR